MANNNTTATKVVIPCRISFANIWEPRSINGSEEKYSVSWINSPGGNVFAAAEIYTMIRDYPGSVTVRIASIAASAASVVAMAGNLVQMSPTALLMIHDPSTIAMGNAKDMEKAITTLNEVKESIINAYAAKTGLSRNRISKLMSNETWLNAKKAVELGFADEILFADKPKEEDPDEDEPDSDPDEPEKEEEDGDEKEEQKKPFKLKEADAVWQYSTKAMGQTILNRLGVSDEAAVPETDAPAQEPAEAGVNGAPEKTEEPSESDKTEKVSDKPAVPVIGMDGRTEDGSVPYEILKDRLEWMK